jgi:transposase-like protein
MVRRWHGREFKLEAVRLVGEGGAPAAQIARDLGDSSTFAAQVDEGVRDRPAA